MKIRSVTTLALAATSVLLLSACASGNTGASPSASVSSVEISSVGKVTRDASLAAQVPTALKSSGLRVVTSAPFAPFEQFDSQNKLEGVDVDLANAIGAKLGVSTKISNLDFSGVIPSLQSRSSDLAMAAMADNPERRKVLDFVDYATDGGSKLVIAKTSAATLTTFTDLCGKSVGVEKGSTYNTNVVFNQRLCTQAGKSPVNIVSQASQGSAMLAIQSGSISALMTGGISASVLVAAQPTKVSVVKDKNAPDGYFTSANPPKIYTGIGILKSNSQLTDVVFDAVKSLGDDGTTAKIFKKWGIENYAVLPAVKNQGK